MPETTLNYQRCMESAGIALASGDQANAERALRAAILSVEEDEDSQLELGAALNKLGTLKQEQGAHSEAEELFRRSLELGERALGPDHLGLVASLKGLGTTLILQGEPVEAEPTLARALAISERHLGEDHPDLVILINDLTRLYLKQSAFAFAEPLVLRLLEMKRHKGDDHPEVATVLASLAVVRQALGRHEDAEQLWRRVLSIRERHLAPNHFSIATALEHLAETCAARGNLRESVSLLQRAMTIRETTLGREHASLRNSRERIADLELQASDDAFGLPSALPPAPAPAPDQRQAQALAPSAALARLPQERTSLPMREVTFAATHPLDRIVAPTSMGLAMTAIKPTPLEPASYLDTLDHIKTELDATEPRAESDDVGFGAALVASVSAFFAERRALAAVVVLGVIALPLAAWGVAGAARSNNMKFVENDIATTPKIEVSSAPPAVSNDSVVRAAAKSERSSAGRAEGELHLSIPGTPVVVKVDSVRGIVSPFSPSNESVLKHLASSPELRRSGGLTTSAPVRARLIGNLPTPRYPRQQIRGGTGGEVRVRFDVDTLGRPVMSTFTVVGAPLAQLANAVRQVIPGIRFEPARTPWPENRPIVETVELAFQFALPTAK